MKINKKLIAVIFLVLIFSFTACSKVNEKHIDDSDKESTEQYIDDEKRANPLGISSTLYEKCEKGQFLDEAGNVKYLGSLLYDDELADKKKYVDITIHEYSDSKMLIEYLYASEKDLEEGIDLERHLMLYEKNTGELLKELVIKQDEAYIEKKANCLSIVSTKDSEFTAQTYDFELNEIAKFTVKEDEGSVSVTSDGKRLYYVKKHRLCVYDSQTDESKIFDSKNEFMAHSVINVLTDESGHDYVMFSGMAADYNAYNFIYDTFNCEVVCAGSQDIAYEMHNGFVIRSKFLEICEHLSWIVGVSDSKAFYYDLSDEMKEKSKNGELVQLLVLGNGDLLFNTSDSEKVYVEVYDKDTGKIKASTTINITDIRREPLTKLSGQDMEYYTGNMTIFNKTFYISENVMLLTLNDYYGTEYYLEWQMDDAIDNHMIVVSDYKIGTEMLLDISGFDNELLLPGEVSEELKPLKEQADRLEEEYDIEINIGDECSDVSESYLIYPLNDYDKVKVALENLELALEKYPDNFFSQFKYEGVAGIDIHISSEIIGISDEALSEAGGYKCIENGKLKLVMDSNNEDAFNTTFHHELCHAIDEVISYKQVYSDEPIFDELKWNELNPYEDMYSYSYVDWGKEEYWCYAYGMGPVDPDSGVAENDAYFVDTYAMTYPTEDRARLFENIMREDGKFIDFENSPNLLKKINYYAECIRATFDTTGWEDIPWEAYME